MDIEDDQSTSNDDSDEGKYRWRPSYWSLPCPLWWGRYREGWIGRAKCHRLASSLAVTRSLVVLTSFFFPL